LSDGDERQTEHADDAPTGGSGEEEEEESETDDGGDGDATNEPTASTTASTTDNEEEEEDAGDAESETDGSKSNTTTPDRDQLVKLSDGNERQTENNDNDNDDSKSDTNNKKDGDRKRDGEVAEVAAATDDAPSTIRKWGCDLTETPLIFVHNGKSGGGNIRARLAAAARNYTRDTWSEVNNDGHFYPVPSSSSSSDGDFRRGRFCNSLYPHYTQIPDLKSVPLTSRTYEGVRSCNATTPLGIAVACNHPYQGDGRGRNGGIQLPNYRSSYCSACDDDYYLQIDYHFGNEEAGGGVGDQRNRTRHQLLTQRKKKNRKILRPFDPPLLADVLDPKKEDPMPTCDVVFTAHNNIGAELNWLPPRYLKHLWWDNSEFSSGKGGGGESLERYWEGLLDDRHRRRKKLEARVRGEAVPEDDDDEEDKSRRWCPGGYKSRDVTRYDRPSTPTEYEDAYEVCGTPLAREADKAFVDAFFPSDDGGGSSPKNYSPFYASMPIHRVTVMRSPWSWVISKFFWHSLQLRVPARDDGKPSCYDFAAEVPARDGPTAPVDPITGRTLGWCEQFVLIYLIKLCGNDCRVRYELGLMTLAEIEAQVADNLRNAFSVVGILEEEESFYDMITDRIAYVTMDLNMDVAGGSHATAKTDENIACKKLYGTDEGFRDTLRKSVPAFAALERIYHVGVEVNAFQKEELRECKVAKGESPYRGNYTKLTRSEKKRAAKEKAKQASA